MTPELMVASQVSYFMRFMKTKQERRAWMHHCLHRAEELEKDWPVAYRGLTEALKEALRSSRDTPSQPSKPAP